MTSHNYDVILVYSWRHNLHSRRIRKLETDSTIRVDPLSKHYLSSRRVFFRQRLKTHLFRRFYPDLIIWHSDL